MLALERPDNMFEIIKSCEFWAKVNRFVIVQTIFTLLKNIIAKKRELTSV